MARKEEIAPKGAATPPTMKGVILPGNTTAALWRLCVFSVTLAAVAWFLCSGAVPAAAAPAAPKYEADMSAFMAEVDKTYPFLDLKGIRADWSAAKMRLTAAAGTCRSDTDFLGLVLDAIRCLRDAHMDLVGAKVKPTERPPLYYPGLSFLLAEPSATGPRPRKAAKCRVMASTSCF